MTPSEVKYESGTSSLDVTWDDGSVVSYPCWVLRGFCPCAHCQGHGGGPPKFVTPLNPRATAVENVTPVGNYGMCVVWEDGHDTGIYSFSWLGRLNLDAYASGEFPNEGTDVAFRDAD